MKILFASSEVYPLMKTGGLADVSCHLPKALHALQQDVRIIMPAYQDAIKAAKNARPLFSQAINATSFTLFETQLPGSPVKVWLIDVPALFDRPGNPYLTPEKQPWPDQAQRFACFSQIVSRIAQGIASLCWQPDIVHCNDWHTGLVPVYLHQQSSAPPVLFTIHNLAYQGLFSYDTFKALALDHSLWHFEALEFYQQLSFMKGGLVFADWINTVSPTYAREVKTPAFGEGLHDVLRAREQRFCGILNGIDQQQWNPATDHYLSENYSLKTLDAKQNNKQALQKAFNLPDDSNSVLIGSVSRLVEQKGFDLVVQALPEICKRPVQFILLGSGDTTIERALQIQAARFPQQIALSLTFDEALAHSIVAGSDFFLMPSRFEPCGLTQMQCLRYGTLPIARRVGGLADTINDAGISTPGFHWLEAMAVARAPGCHTRLADNASDILSGKTDASDLLLNADNATGILFDNMSVNDLVNAVDKSIYIYTNTALKKHMQLNGMKKDFSWRVSAKKYIELYQLVVKNRQQDK